MLRFTAGCRTSSFTLDTNISDPNCDLNLFLFKLGRGTRHDTTVDQHFDGRSVHFPSSQHLPQLRVGFAAQRCRQGSQLHISVRRQTLLTKNIIVFLDVTPCCFLLQSSLHLKVKAARTCLLTQWRNNAEDSSLFSYRRKNIKPHLAIGTNILDYTASHPRRRPWEL